MVACLIMFHLPAHQLSIQYYDYSVSLFLADQAFVIGNSEQDMPATAIAVPFEYGKTMLCQESRILSYG